MNLEDLFIVHSPHRTMSIEDCTNKITGEFAKLNEEIDRRNDKLNDFKNKRGVTVMCSPQDFSTIETVVSELIRMRKTFTAEDVYNRIHSKYVRRPEDLSGFTESAKGVSIEVRKMFNGRHPLFANYGSTLVQHNSGPILYFALPHHAKLKANKIAKRLS